MNAGVSVYDEIDGVGERMGERWPACLSSFFGSTASMNTTRV